MQSDIKHQNNTIHIKKQARGIEIRVCFAISASILFYKIQDKVSLLFFCQLFESIDEDSGLYFPETFGAKISDAFNSAFIEPHDELTYSFYTRPSKSVVTSNGKFKLIYPCIACSDGKPEGHIDISA